MSNFDPTMEATAAAVSDSRVYLSNQGTITNSGNVYDPTAYTYTSSGYHNITQAAAAAAVAASSVSVSAAAAVAAAATTGSSNGSLPLLQQQKQPQQQQQQQQQQQKPHHLQQGAIPPPGSIAGSSVAAGGIVVGPAGTAALASLDPTLAGKPNSPATVKWLEDNYDVADGVSLPRSTLYDHYRVYCNQTHLDAVNPASFGKLIRSVFPNLKTRRLGTRGNSKYHYYGIRVRPTSPLSSYVSEAPDGSGYIYNPPESVPADTSTKKTTSAPVGVQETKLTLLQNMPVLTASDLPTGDATETDCTAASEFSSFYIKHCQSILDAVSRTSFPTVQNLWTSMWSSLPSHFQSLLKYDSVAIFVERCDQNLYDTIVHMLIPDVLKALPAQLTQDVRSFAKNLDTWLQAALVNLPVCKLIELKHNAVSVFAQTLRRYTSLNHLAQAARQVLQDPEQIAQMLKDLNRVDLADVQEQASWVCQCDPQTVLRLESEFKQLLDKQSPLRDWACWLQEVVEDSVGEPPLSMNVKRFTQMCRQFLMKWSFYSSLVVRDLTLRSAKSFGSFHLMRLLYDEYVFYLVEQHLARYTGETVIAVMSWKRDEDMDGLAVATEPSYNAEPGWDEEARFSNKISSVNGKRAREDDDGNFVKRPCV